MDLQMEKREENISGCRSGKWHCVLQIGYLWAVVDMRTCETGGIVLGEEGMGERITTAASTERRGNGVREWGGWGRLGR